MRFAVLLVVFLTPLNHNHLPQASLLSTQQLQLVFHSHFLKNAYPNPPGARCAFQALSPSARPFDLSTSDFLWSHRPDSSLSKSIHCTTSHWTQLLLSLYKS